jgi:hypothetical protein
MSSKISIKYAFAAAWLALLVGCGGGGGSSDRTPAPPNNPNPPPADPIGVTVSPATAEVDLGDVMQFTATVTNTSNSAVAWQVNDIAGGNATVGTISATGLYTAPSELPASSSVTIRAVSEADSGKSGTATAELVRFSARTLSGPYAFQFRGTDGDVLILASGTFEADGDGSMSGVQDVNAGGTFAGDLEFTGTYNISEDGEGTATLTSPLGARDIAFVVIDRQSALFTQVDGVESVSGRFERQDPDAFTNATFDGAFVYAFSGFEEGVGAIGAIGRIVSNGSGSVTGGDEDIKRGAAFSAQVPIQSGSYDVSEETGRGTASLTNAIATTPYVLQVVNADRAFFMTGDTDFTVMGVLERQSGDISTASLAGDYVFLAGGPGDLGQIAAAGRFSADGNGNLTDGILDSNYAGSINDGLDFTGSYAFDGEGRGNATVAAYSVVTRMIDPARLVFLQTDADRVLSGRAYLQQSGASLNGSYAVAGHGRRADAQVEALGTMTADGAGLIDVDLSYVVADDNPFVVNVSPVTASGTIVITDGRGTGSAAGFSETMRLYPVASDRFVLISLDPDQTDSFEGWKRF